MPTILVTNDDGVQSPGLLALAQALRSVADVRVLAPERNWSASSHAKTMHKPLRLYEIKLGDGSVAHCSSGSPTDCVALALGGALGCVPDLVVSGINNGHNLGIDITYSGTVACAMEATIKGVPGIAISTTAPGETEADIDAVRRTTADVARRAAEEVLERGLPLLTLLNINVPGLPEAEVRGVRVTRMGGREYDRGEVLERADPYGRPYYWLGGAGPMDKYDEDCDVGAIKAGYISISPITLDLTAYHFMADLARWPFVTGAPAAVRGA